MKARIKVLSLTVWVTVCLLVLGASLVVLGIFNEQLKWDIFSSQVEAALYGIFFSCITLSLFGVAITFVVGIKQIVEAVESLQRRRSLDSSVVPPKTRRLTYAAYVLGLFTAFAALIGALELIDHQIQVHRSQVFKRIVAEEMQGFGDRLSQPLSQRNQASITSVPTLLTELMRALNDLTFIQDTTLYVADPQDNRALWRYEDYQLNSQNQPFFSRFLIVKESEEAIRQALNGNSTALETLNQETDFQWYYLIENEQGQPLGILRIEGDPYENFRDYSF